MQQIFIAIYFISEPAVKAEDTKPKDSLSCWRLRSGKADSFSRGSRAQLLQYLGLIIVAASTSSLSTTVLAPWTLHVVANIVVQCLNVACEMRPSLPLSVDGFLWVVNLKWFFWNLKLGDCHLILTYFKLSFAHFGIFPVLSPLACTVTKVLSLVKGWGAIFLPG